MPASNNQHFGRSRLFNNLEFYIHKSKNKEAKAEAKELRELLFHHSARQARSYDTTNVIFMTVFEPRLHIVEISVDTDVINPSQPTGREVIQMFARRTGQFPDTGQLRIPVIQAQWVYDCVQERRRLKYSDGWEILVEVDHRNVEVEVDVVVGNAGSPIERNPFGIPMDWAEEGCRTQRRESDNAMDWSEGHGHHDLAEDGVVREEGRGGPASSPRPQNVWPAPTTYAQAGDSNSSNGPIEVQVPSFSMPTQRPLSCQIPQMDTESKVQFRMDQITASRGDWKPVSRSPAGRNTVWSKPHSTAPMAGVFARGQFLPFAFHVLGGPMQKEVEINISKFGGGTIVPLHRASIVVVPEQGVRTPSTVLTQRLVKEADPSRVIVSLDWISDCLALDQLLDVGTYLLQPSSRSNQDDKKSGSRREFQYHRSDMLSIQLEELSMSVAPSLLAQATSPPTPDMPHRAALYPGSHSSKDLVSTIIFGTADDNISPPTTPQLSISSGSIRDDNQHVTMSPTRPTTTDEAIDARSGTGVDCLYPDGYMDWLRNKYIGWNGSDPRSDLVKETALWNADPEPPSSFMSIFINSLNEEQGIRGGRYIMESQPDKCLL